MPVRLEDVAADLAAGYPAQGAAETAPEFAEVLRIVLPALTEKARAARQQGSVSVEDVWKAIRSDSEPGFQAAVARVGRLKVLYVASKFMNNRAIGTVITQAALAMAIEKEG